VLPPARLSNPPVGRSGLALYVSVFVRSLRNATTLFEVLCDVSEQVGGVRLLHRSKRRIARSCKYFVVEPAHLPGDQNIFRAVIAVHKGETIGSCSCLTTPPRTPPRFRTFPLACELIIGFNLSVSKNIDVKGGKQVLRIQNFAVDAGHSVRIAGPTSYQLGR